MPLIKWITVRLDVSETNGAVANKGMEPQGRRRISPFRVTKRSTKLRRLSKTTRLRVHVQTVGLNAETKKVSAPSRRGRMSLDIPFYRTFPISAFYRDLTTVAVRPSWLLGERDSLQCFVKSRAVSSPTGEMRVEVIVVG